ncbi:putative non-specific serine/threonine protein kinase [Helianthus anomalus]
MSDFDHLKIPMKDLDPAKVIGCGGFGRVYKGELSLPEGQVTVAFKQLDRRLGQGNTSFGKRS